MKQKQMRETLQQQIEEKQRFKEEQQRQKEIRDLKIEEQAKQVTQELAQNENLAPVGIAVPQVSGTYANVMRDEKDFLKDK